MDFKQVHNFNLSIEEMKKIQKELANKVTIQSLEKEPTIIAGVDVAYFEIDGKEKAVGVITVVDINTHTILEEVYCYSDITTEYIPGLLAFRELPIILDTWKKLKTNPDVVMFDGNGLFHEENMGIATHASFFIEKPCIGVAKSYCNIENKKFEMPSNNLWEKTDLKVKDLTVGVVLRTKVDCKPIFISIGNNITLEEIINITKKLITKDNRIPVPTLLADSGTKKYRELILKNKIKL